MQHSRAVVFLLLSACSWVGSKQYVERVQDVDGDGVIDGRFGGRDCDDLDPLVGDCDLDRDGFKRLGFGEDCDDDNATVHPEATEICNGIDDDCSGLADDNVAEANQTAWYADVDGDGVGSTEPLFACEQPAGFLDTGGDCDDNDATIFPGARELCDAADRDCDGDPTFNSFDETEWLPDLDGDGYGTEGNAVLACEAPASTGLPGDCDDADPTISPDADEVCDGVDNNCNGIVDLDAQDGVVLRYRDNDGDGFGHGGELVCAGAEGFSTFDGDCEDNDALIHPGAPEICGDTVRQDCSSFDPFDCDSDGEISTEQGGPDCDDEDPEVNTSATEICDDLDNNCDGLFNEEDPNVTGDSIEYFDDEDGDGAGGPTSLGLFCGPPAGGVLGSDDCDDSDASIAPGAPEACNNTDDDCDGAVDELPSIDVPTFYLDTDGDNFGDPNAPHTDSCTAPGGYAINADDCNDADTTIHPGVTELCDGQDNDCDGLVDDDDSNVTLLEWYLDSDGDGLGNALSIMRACTAPMMHVAEAGDCDDNDPDVQTDVLWYLDGDGDGDGRPDTALPQCTRPVGYVSDGRDCDDADGTVYPSAPEVCDGKDNNCDGDIDNNPIGAPLWFPDTDMDGIGTSVGAVASCVQPIGHVSISGDCDDLDIGAQFLGIWYPDLDGDGYGDDSTDGTLDCNPAHATHFAGDCDDGNALINPSQVEVCNGFDDDCDMLVDDHDPDVVKDTWFRDGDGDGFGADEVILRSCQQPAGFIEQAGDCDDGDAEVYFSVVTATAPSDLDMLLPHICDGGAVLLTPGVDFEMEQVTRRSVLIASADANELAQIQPHTDDGFLMRLTPGAEVVFENIEFQAPDACTAPCLGAGGPVFDVAPGAMLDLRQVTFAGSDTEPLFVDLPVRSAGDLALHDVSIAWVQTRSSFFLIDGGTFTVNGLNVHALTVPGAGSSNDARLARIKNNARVELDQVVETGRGLAPTFRLSHNSFTTLSNSAFYGGKKVVETDDPLSTHLTVVDSRFIDQIDGIALNLRGRVLADISGSVFAHSLRAPNDPPAVRIDITADVTITHSVFANYGATRPLQGLTPQQSPALRAVATVSQTAFLNTSDPGLLFPSSSAECWLTDNTLNDCPHYSSPLTSWNSNWMHYEPDPPLSASAADWLFYPYEDFSAAGPESSLIDLNGPDIGLTGSLGQQAWREDTDGDNLSDGWELHFFGSIEAVNGTENADGDAFLDLDEYINGTNPCAPPIGPCLP